LGALYRITSQTEVYLVPDNSGLFQLTLILPPTSSSGDYIDAPHSYGDSPSQQPLIRAVAIADYRDLGFAYILGAFSSDPEDGGYLSMALGPMVDNTRPLSYSLTNNRYNSVTRVAQAATTEAARQEKLPITGLIEANANLALELYDVVEVTEAKLGWSNRPFRVRRIREVWERGRLTQTLYLGPTD
jgi:hypothetical protein